MHAFLLLLLLPLGTTESSSWTHLGGNPQHTAAAGRGPATLDRVRWTVTLDPNEALIDQASPVVADGRVIVAARRLQASTHVGNRVIAFSVDDGCRLWACDLPSDTLDSWSSPTLDPCRGTVLVSSAKRLYALRDSDGMLLWETPLRRSVVNASPVVTDDLSISGTPTDRVLLTDYHPLGSDASLYCINVSPHDLPHNPFKPGDLVWRLPIGSASGATPAYRDGRAYLASGPGRVLAVDVLDPPRDPNDPNRPVPAWDSDLVSPRTPNEGFYGGVSLADGRLLAAQYEFQSGSNSARLLAIDADDGSLLWSAASERSSSIPLPLGDDVLLSGGIVGFNSEPKIQRFAPDGNQATLLWEASAGNGVPVGGYAHHPARVGDRLYVGRPSTSMFFGPHTDLYILDLGREPNDPAFVVDQYSGAGGTPALAYGRLFSIGPAGLVAFEPSDECAADTDASGTVDLSDLAAVLADFGAMRGMSGYNAAADIDLSGVIDLGDLAILLAVFGEGCE